MTLGRTPIPIEARNVWNLNEPLSNDGVGLIRSLQAIRRELHMSPNDYFWHPIFHEIVADHIAVNHEKLSEDQDQDQLFVSFYRQQEEERKRFKRPEFSRRFIKELRKLVRSLDLNRKLPGRPSCSTEPGNWDDYYAGELFLQSEVASAVRGLVVWTRPPKTPEAVKDLPDRSSVVKDPPSSTSAESPKSSPSPLPWGAITQETTKRLTFPNPKAEQIYHYVDDVLECFHRQRNQYMGDCVFAHLAAYKRKVMAVQAAFQENLFGIRDKLRVHDLQSIDVDLKNSSEAAVLLMEEMIQHWVKCLDDVSFLEPIKKKMEGGCLDRETLGVARGLAMSLVKGMKKTRECLYECLEPVRDIYGVLCEFQDYMRS